MDGSSDLKRIVTAQASNYAEAEGNLAINSPDKLGTQLIALLGLSGFSLAWIAAAWFHIHRPSCLVIDFVGLTAIPMIAGNVLGNKTHRRPSSGLDTSKISIDWQRGRIKFIGSWGTVLVVALLYSLIPEYSRDYYEPVWRVFSWASFPTLVLSFPYIYWVDRRMIHPEDGYWQAGLLFLGRWQEADFRILKCHLGGTLVKAFFLPFIMGGAAECLSYLGSQGMRMDTFQNLYVTCLNLMYSIDVTFGTLGYLLTLRILDSHIRSVEPTLLGWVATLSCYAPFSVAIWTSLLSYRGKTGWAEWLAAYPVAAITWGLTIIVLHVVYVWSTCAFGCSFSNLTNRGIIVTGPYRYLKHPAYFSKNVAWWMMSVPFATQATRMEMARACLCLLTTNLIYVIRAWTEERHLRADVGYRAYCDWMRCNSLWAHALRSLKSIWPERRRPYEPALRDRWPATVVLGLIISGSLLRFAICFQHNPLDYLFSDPKRHWMNGQRLFSPDLMGASDPLGYQIYLYWVELVTDRNRFALAFICGALSVAMPWTFYRAGLELDLTKMQALCAWAMLAWLPSLFVIYHYFMMETLLLPLIGVAFWMSVRCLKTGGWALWFLTVILWMLACFTKATIVPLALGCLIFIWSRQPKKGRRFLVAVGLVALGVIPNALRTDRYLGFIAPLGNSWITRIQQRSGDREIKIHFNGGTWGFASPSVGLQPIHPLSSWMMERSLENTSVIVSAKSINGVRDWEKAYDGIKCSAAEWRLQLRENVVLFLFSPSWPDSNQHEWDGWINYQLRWMWAPVIFFVLDCNFREFIRGEFNFLPVTVTVCVLFLLFQNIATTEGRYRKPAEPLLMLNLVWALRSRPGLRENHDRDAS